MTRIEDTLKNLNKLRLTTEVKTRIREELLAYAELHAVSSAPIVSSLRFFSMRMYAGLAAIVVIVGSIGGTAYASEETLPGDVLYSFKVSVSEPMQTALVPSDRGKAAWHAILAERRLHEAAQLAAENKLSSETREMLAANFNTHIEASTESAEQLEESGDTAGSLSVRSDLEARLTAHEHILNVIEDHFAASVEASSTPTHIALTELLAVVHAQEESVASARLALEDQLAPDGTASTTTAIAIAVAPIRAKVANFSKIHVDAQAGIDTMTDARSKEVEHILERNATLLAKFMPVATTTATTTDATTTPAVDADDIATTTITNQ